MHQAAAAGTRGGGGALPHGDTIQASFGRHDVSAVQAHTGGAATAACEAMGATAYATGSDVAFAGAPDLHTAAHEAAHVVQQRGGVSLKGGVGQVGDVYEQHADQVADAVVSGRSAEGLLDRFAGAEGGGAAVQRHDDRGECEMGGPPAKADPPTPEGAAALDAWMVAHIAGHAQAATTYTYYEVMDEYLGPWGESGYLLGYGRHYNIAFTTNATLMADPVAAQWVWRTTIYLQEAIREYVNQRYSAGTLGAMTEAELRSVAFASHPQAYTDGGLTLVATAAPELIPTIASIPAIEFSPTSDNFGASVAQVFSTVGLVLPRAVGNLGAALAGPAHNRSLVIAAQRDRQRFNDQMALSRGLGNLEQAIQRGYFDSIRTLDEITAGLNAAQFPDQGFARYAQTIVAQANEKKRELARGFAAEIEGDATLGAIYDRTQPGWRQWLPEE